MHVIEAGSGREAFPRLQHAAAGAVRARAKRVLVDLGELDAVDGATLAVIASMGGSLGPSTKVALVTLPAVASQLKEWRLDALWLLFSDRASAEAALSQ